MFKSVISLVCILRVNVGLFHAKLHYFDGKMVKKTPFLALIEINRLIGSLID